MERLDIKIGDIILVRNSTIRIEIANDDLEEGKLRDRGIVLWFIIIGFYAWQISLSQYILKTLPLTLLIGVAVINVIIFGQAAYLRAHKKEPFLWNSVICAIFMATSTYFLGRTFGAVGMVVGYFVITAFLGLVWATWIFVTKRGEWHSG